MKLFLYRNESSENTLGKTLAGGVEIDINLKRSVDVVSPELLLTARPGVDYLSVNYAHIPALGRYYFVNDVQNINGSMWQLSLDCDVLETYKAAILAANARFRRGLKQGDYVTADLLTRVDSTSTKHMSNITLDDQAHTNVLTVLQHTES